MTERMAPAQRADAPLLAVEGLCIGYRDGLGRITPAVQDLSFTLPAGGSLGLVGESGSGKSTVARALLGHYRGSGERLAGAIRLDGRLVDEHQPSALAAIRGIDVAFVPQNPLSSLTYHLRVGAQLVEVLRTRAGLDRAEARRRALELMAQTGLPEPEVLFERYPHQLSGGQRQRVVIACALACRPRLLVLDEPTTALDKTTEVQVLDLVRDLRRQLGAAVILVTHDLNVVATMCEQVLVMQGGRMVEQGPTAATLAAPTAPYTRALVDAVLRMEAPPPRADADAGQTLQPAAGPVLQVQGLGHSYAPRAWWAGRDAPVSMALQGVSLQLQPGQVLGVIGESGSGKTTLGAALAGLLVPSAGQMRFQGEPLPAGVAARTADQRRRVQMVFQDPLSSLNPRQRVGTAVARPLQVFFGLSRAQAWQRAAELLEELGMEASYLQRFARQLSGGQQQRVAIARALAAEPDLVICDEVTSALDASIQQQVLDLLVQQQSRRKLSLVVITHDLAVVWRLAHQVLVLRDGRVHEQGDTAEVFANPQSSYTRALLESATRASRADAAVPARPPFAVEPDSFQPLCQPDGRSPHASHQPS